MMRRRLVAAAILMAFAIIAGGTRFLLPAGAQSEPTVIDLIEQNDSGVSGRADLVSADGATWVQLELEGGDGSYIAYLHRGDCGDYIEGSSIPLGLAVAGEALETAVDLPVDELLTGRYLIDLHVAEGTIETLLDPATSAACGEIGERESEPDTAAAGTTQPPVTGIGPIQTGRDWMLVLAFTLATFSLALAVTSLRYAPQPVEAPVVINVVALHRLRGLTK